MWIGEILINLALCVFLPLMILEWCGAFPRYKTRKKIRHLIGKGKFQIRVNRDILSDNRKARLQDMVDSGQKLLKEPKVAIAGLKEWLDKAEKVYTDAAANQDFAAPREIVDTAVVIVGVVFGVRALFLQPFKIPTASMEPTLFGIHIEDQLKKPALGPVGSFHNYWVYGRRFINPLAPFNGQVYNLDFQQVQKSGGLIPTLQFPMVLQPTGAGQPVPFAFKVPGDEQAVGPYVHYFNEQFQQDGKVAITQGQPIIDGAMVTGDHLFVDRTSFYFSEPERGDVTVFLTDGFPFMKGRYYIKRLVGMPGDTLKVEGTQLMVKTPGTDKFVPVDASFGDAFRKINSWKGGYRGHSPVGCFDPNTKRFEFRDEQHNNQISTFNQTPFVAENGEFTVPEDFYFMMGDNTYNSRDSRYFGPVPRENLVGTASFCWWPISRRWGFVDTKEPLDEPSTDPMHRRGHEMD